MQTNSLIHRTKLPDPYLLEQIVTEPGFRPTAGKCVIRLDPTPETTQSGLFLPQDSLSPNFIRDRQTSFTGTVLSMTPRKPVNVEGFKIGDRVVVLLTAEDLDRRVIMTDVSRVVAVVEAGVGFRP
jgi:hypothetical protein